MDIFDNNVHLSEPRSSIISAFTLLLLSLLGFMFIGPSLGIVLNLPAYDYDFQQLESALSNPTTSDYHRTPVLILQAMAALVGMVLIPWYYLRRFKRQSAQVFFQKQVPWGMPMVLTFLLVVMFMGANSLVIQWNAGLSYEFISESFHQWASDKEGWLAELTGYMVNFSSPWQFLFGLVVIAVLPAIGEELVFRGFLQNEFHRGTGSIHAGIWISAFLFSAIHMQFFGFFPRLLLGALFGYMYYWSGNLLIPMAAHFFNNAITLSLVYFYQKGVVPFDVMEVEVVPLHTGLFFLIITTGLLVVFRGYFQKRYSTYG
jgi:uncharacterized protein